jgi:hypothetical protein
MHYFMSKATVQLKGLEILWFSPVDCRLTELAHQHNAMHF